MLTFCDTNSTLFITIDRHFQNMVNMMINVDIETGVVNGRFPRRALSAVLDWYILHQQELMANWEAAMNRKPLLKIKPLE